MAAGSRDGGNNPCRGFLRCVLDDAGFFGHGDSLQEQEFARQLAAEGFDDILTSCLPAAPQVAAHARLFALKAMVLEGEITLGVAGQRTTYRKGGVFAMGPGL